MAFSPDSRLLASGSHDVTICLWDVGRRGAAPVVLRGHCDKVWCVAFSPDGRFLASSGDDKTIRIWDTHQLERAPTVLAGHDAKVGAVAFSPDGSTLASGGADKTVRLWNMQRLDDLPRVFQIDFPETSGGVSALAWSVDGRTLAIGSDDGTIRLWKARTDELADLVCTKVWRNLRREEWRRFVGEGIPYQPTCPNLPAAADAAGDNGPETEDGEPLSAPILHWPANGAAFHHYPRTLTFQWVAMPGAQTYTIQSEFDGSGDAEQGNWLPWRFVPLLKTPRYTFDFVGGQKGRWRVWAADSTGREGPKSDWWTFSFTS